MTSVRKNVIANYIGRSWTAVLGILLIPLYIKFLGIESYGLVGFFASLTAVIGILDLGIGSTMTRELAKRSVKSNSSDSQRNLVRTLELIYWGIAFFSGIIIFFGAPFIANYWIKSEIDVNTLINAVRFMALSIAFRFPMSLYQGGLMGLQKQVFVNKIVVSIGTLRGFGAVLILWLFSPTIEAFFIWQAIISLVESFVFFISIWKILPKSLNKPTFKVDILKEIWKYTAAISANALLGILMSQLDKIILSKMLPLKMFAYYSIATTLASSIWLLIIPFNTAIFPKLIQLFEGKKTKELRLFFHDSTQILAFLLLPFSFILIFFSNEILFLWMQDPIIADNAYLIMSFLALGTLLNGLVSLPANCATGFGWPTLITYTNLFQSVIIIPLILVMTYWLQGIGASIAWVVLNSVYLIFMVPFFFKRFFIDEKRQWFTIDIGVPTFVAFLVSFTLKSFSPALNTSFEIISWLLLSGLLTLFFTGISLSVIRNFTLSYLDKLYKKWK